MVWTFLENEGLILRMAWWSLVSELSLTNYVESIGTCAIVTQCMTLLNHAEVIAKQKYPIENNSISLSDHVLKETNLRIKGRNIHIIIILFHFVWKILPFFPYCLQ